MRGAINQAKVYLLDDDDELRLLDKNSGIGTEYGAIPFVGAPLLDWNQESIRI